MPTTAVNGINLTDYSSSNDREVWALDGHTASKPRLVIQKRRVTGSVDRQNSTLELQVVYATEDADGNPLQSKNNLTLTASHPSQGQLADLQAAVDIFQALIASGDIDSAIEDLVPIA